MAVTEGMADMAVAVAVAMTINPQEKTISKAVRNKDQGIIIDYWVPGFKKETTKC